MNTFNQCISNVEQAVAELNKDPSFNLQTEAEPMNGVRVYNDHGFTVFFWEELQGDYDTAEAIENYLDCGVCDDWILEAV